MHKTKELFLAAASTVFGSILFLAVMETYSWHHSGDQWVFPHTRFDSQLGWSNLKKKSTTFNGKTYTTNTLGFRSSEVNPDKDHILIIGDSVAFGLGVEDNETVSSYLSQMTKAQVLNLATPGYGIDQYYLILKKHIVAINPKHVVVVIYTRNDLADTASNALSGIVKPFFILEQGRLQNLQPVISKFSCGNLAAKSWTLNKFFPRGSGRFLCGEKILSEDSARETVAALIRKIGALAAQFEADLLFVLSPSLEGVQGSICDLSRFKEKFCDKTDMAVKSTHNFFKKILRETSYRYIDFSNTLLLESRKTDPKNFYNRDGEDVHHYSPAGNNLLAQKIASYLEQTPLEHSLKKRARQAEIADTDAEAHLTRGIIHFADSQLEKAVKEFQETIRINPRHTEARLNLGLAYAKSGNYPDAIAELNAAIQIDPINKLAHNNLAALYLHLGQYAPAVAELEKALDLKPENALAHLNLGLAYDGLKNGHEAIFHVLIARELSKIREFEFLSRIAENRLHELTGKYDINPNGLTKNVPTIETLKTFGEIKTLTKELTKYPDDVSDRIRLANAYYSVGNYEKSMEAFNAVIELFPNMPDPYNSAAMVLIAQGAFQEATPFLEKAIMLNPDMGEAHYHLSLVYDHLNNGLQAATHAARAMTLLESFENPDAAKSAERNLMSFFDKYALRKEDVPITDDARAKAFDEIR